MQVFVINAEESNIKYIDKDNKFLDRVFVELIENYDFDVDNAAIKNLLSTFVNARDNNGFGVIGIGEVMVFVQSEKSGVKICEFIKSVTCNNP